MTAADLPEPVGFHRRSSMSVIRGLSNFSALFCICIEMKRVVPVRLLIVVVTLQSVAFCQPQEVGKTLALQQLGHGVIVESVVKGSQGERLGIHPGDVMLSWSRGAAHGVIDSPFGLAYVAIEQASQGRVTVHGLSTTRERLWVFGSDQWGVQARPNLQGENLRIYLEAMELAAADKPAEAAKVLASAAAAADKSGIPWLGSWFLSRAGRILFHAQKWQASDEAFAQAIQLSQNAGPIIREELFRQWASSFEYRGDLTQAAKYYQENLRESERLGAETMAVANSLLLLASVDLARNDTDAAETHLRQGLKIAKRLGPSSYQIASIFEDFGILFEYRGDLGKAEEYYLRALPIEEQHFPNSRQLANTLTNLGTLVHQRGDLSRAEKYHRRALAIASKIEENGPQVADILSNLGECILAKGDTFGAEKFAKRALQLRERAVPETFAIALNLATLGKIARIRHDFPRAEEYYAQAIEAARKAEIPEPDLATLLTGKGDVLRDRGDYAAAADTYRQALSIVEKSSPGTIDHAEILAELAGALRQQGDLNAAAELYPQALTALESRALQLGGVEEDRSRYRAWYVRYYQGYIDLLLQLGRQDEAFAVLEGSHARTLLEMLSHAHINVRQGADNTILERELALHRAIQAKTEARLQLVTSENSSDQVSRLDREIDTLLMQETEVKAQLRSSNPGYSALTQARQLTTPEIRNLLDDNTLLLEYSLGNDHSHLWAATNKSLFVFDLPAKGAIENAARKMYALLAFRKPAHPNPGPIEADEEYDRAALKLSKMVVSPVAHLLGAKRLLIVADGALQYIPFSALPTPGRASASKPLIVEHEIINLPSASVLDEIRRQRKGRPRPAGVVAVLADPVFESNDERVGTRCQDNCSANSATQLGKDLTRSAYDLGLARDGKAHLNRLLYTRKEADAVLALVPPDKRLHAVDFDANRATVMSGALAKYRIVHFATHGLLNNKHPELSGLVFSLVNKQGKRQDGFLKLQDVYDLKLPVDLVVLSGCETGLGEEISGEGLIGLTRGFMYAGASRVLASLWSVSDSATASLMGEFYKRMEKDHMRPAAALRAAQIFMWNQPQWRSPYYWAAFQMQGEW